MNNFTKTNKVLSYVLHCTTHEIKWTYFPLFQIKKTMGKFTSQKSKLLSLSEKIISKEVSKHILQTIL